MVGICLVCCPNSAFHSEMDTSRPSGPAESHLELQVAHAQGETVKLRFKVGDLFPPKATVFVSRQIANHTCS